MGGYFVTMSRTPTDFTLDPGTSMIYMKSDGRLYRLDPAGVETDLLSSWGLLTPAVSFASVASTYTVTTTLSTITGLSLTLPSTGTYEIRAHLIVQTSSAGTSPTIRNTFAGPTASLSYWHQELTVGNAAVPTFTGFTALTNAATTWTPTTTDRNIIMSGRIVVTNVVTPLTVQIVKGGTIAPTSTVAVGSSLTANKLA